MTCCCYSGLSFCCGCARHNTCYSCHTVCCHDEGEGDSHCCSDCCCFSCHRCYCVFYLLTYPLDIHLLICLVISSGCCCATLFVSHVTASLVLGVSFPSLSSCAFQRWITSCSIDPGLKPRIWALQVQAEGSPTPSRAIHRVLHSKVYALLMLLQRRRPTTTSDHKCCCCFSLKPKAQALNPTS